MKRAMLALMALITLITLMFMSGCIWPPTPSHHSFPYFTTTPRDMVGYGADTFWLYVDAEALAEEMVIDNVNVTHVEIFNCSPSKEKSQSSDPSPHGYWSFDKFDAQLKPQLDIFLKTMQDHKITTIVTFFGGHDMSGVNDDIFFRILNFLKSRSTDGIIINIAAEPGTWTKEPYPGYFNHLTQMLDQNWSGMKAWNYGTRPTTAPGGYWIEYHPQAYTEYGPANGNVMMLTDSYVWFQLNYDTSLQSKIDPAKLIPYAQAVRNQGNGFLYYGQRFTGWDIDKEGIKAIGSTKPKSFITVPLTGANGEKCSMRLPIEYSSSSSSYGSSSSK